MGGRTSSASISKYKAKAYDRVELLVKKGQKDVIKAAADAAGESLNAYINRAIADRMITGK